MAHAQTANQRSQIAVNVAPNIQANDVFNPPCALGTACSVTPINKGVCEDNNGVWYGPGATGLTAAGSSIPSTGFTACWAANQFLHGLNEPLLNVLPTDQSAAATETYKYVVTSWVDYDPQSDGPNTTEIEELFLIKDANGDPLIDRESLNLLAQRRALQMTPVSRSKCSRRNCSNINPWATGQPRMATETVWSIIAILRLLKRWLPRGDSRAFMTSTKTA